MVRVRISNLLCRRLFVRLTFPCACARVCVCVRVCVRHVGALLVFAVVLGSLWYSPDVSSDM